MHDKKAIFVLKIGGQLLTNDNALNGVLQSIKKMIQHGIKIVLVHGGGTQIDILSQKLGHTPQKINGRRITHSIDLEIAKMAVGGTVHLNLLSALKKNGLPALSFSAIANDLFKIELRAKKPVDFGYVGEIQETNPQVIYDLMHIGNKLQMFTPGCCDTKNILVVPPLAATADGTIVNINADTIATQIAMAVHADKLIFFLDVPGVLYKKQVIPLLTKKDILELFAKKIVIGGMRVKLENCLKAIDKGVQSIHLLNGFDKNMEDLLNPSMGTMIISGKQKSEKKLCTAL